MVDWDWGLRMTDEAGIEALIKRLMLSFNLNLKRSILTEFRARFSQPELATELAPSKRSAGILELSGRHEVRFEEVSTTIIRDRCHFTSE
ncbi:MAG: hypothetical protein QXS32_08300 [Candidatus Nezhaarchaeales archaeon]